MNCTTSTDTIVSTVVDFAKEGKIAKAAHLMNEMLTELLQKGMLRKAQRVLVGFTNAAASTPLGGVWFVDVAKILAQCQGYRGVLCEIHESDL